MSTQGITYELASELKKAGFPQGESLDKILRNGVAMAYLRDTKPSDELLDKYKNALKSLKEMYEDDEEYVYVPALHELIEACGDKFYGLHRMVNGTWLAFMYDIEDSTRQVEEGGTSPEEAVANLWIKLNSK